MEIAGFLEFSWDVQVFKLEEDADGWLESLVRFRFGE